MPTSHRAKLSLVATTFAFLIACGTTPPPTGQNPGSTSTDALQGVVTFPTISRQNETSAAPGWPVAARLKTQFTGTYLTEKDDLDTNSWRVGNIPYLRVTVDLQYDTDGYLDQLFAAGNTSASSNSANTDYVLPATVNASTTLKIIVAKPNAQTSSNFNAVLKHADTGATIGTQAITLSSANQIGAYSDVTFHSITTAGFNTTGIAGGKKLQLWLTDIQSGAKFFVGGIRITNGTSTYAVDNVDFTKKDNTGSPLWRTNNLLEVKKLFTPTGAPAPVALHRFEPYLAAGGYVTQRLKALNPGQSVTFNGALAMPTSSTDRTLYAYLQNATTYAAIPNSGQTITVSSTAKRVSFTVTKPTGVTGDVDLVISNIPFGQALYMGNFAETSGTVMFQTNYANTTTVAASGWGLQQNAAQTGISLTTAPWNSSQKALKTTVTNQASDRWFIPPTTTFTYPRSEVFFPDSSNLAFEFEKTYVVEGSFYIPSAALLKPTITDDTSVSPPKPKYQYQSIFQIHGQPGTGPGQLAMMMSYNASVPSRNGLVMVVTPQPNYVDNPTNPRTWRFAQIYAPNNIPTNQLVTYKLEYRPSSSNATGVVKLFLNNAATPVVNFTNINNAYKYDVIDGPSGYVETTTLTTKGGDWKQGVYDFWNTAQFYNKPEITVYHGETKITKLN